MKRSAHAGKGRLNVAVLGVLAGLLINAFAGLALWQNWQAAYERVAQRTVSMAQAYSDFTFRALETYDQILEDIQGFVEEGLPGSQMRSYMARQKREHPYIMNLFAFDSLGQIRYGTNQHNADLSKRDYFTAHRDDDSIGRFMGRPATSLITPGRWFIPVSRRIPAYGSPFLGVAAVTIDIADLTDAFERLREGPDVAIAVVHNSGVLVTRSPAVTDMIGKELPIDGLQGARYRTFQTMSPFDNTMRIVTQRMVPQYPLMVFASLPQRLVFEEWQRSATPIAVSSLLITLAVLALTLHMQRQSHARDHLLSDLARAKEQAEKALTNLEAAQTAMVRSEKLAALGGLVAGIAHEVNTPVGNALTSASFLETENQHLRTAYQQQTLSADDLETYLGCSDEAIRLILSNCQRAAELIHGFKQVAVDQTSGERREFELREYVEEVLLSLRPKLKHRPITVSLDIPAGIMVDGFPGALSQVLTNLVLNSLMHGFDDDQSGTIHIQAEILNHTQIRLMYSDTGRGIPADVQDRIYDPFFTTRRGSGGSGLGMNIVHNIVERTLRGSIHLCSDAGSGVQFCIQFPLINPA